MPRELASWPGEAMGPTTLAGALDRLPNPDPMETSSLREAPRTALRGRPALTAALVLVGAACLGFALYVSGAFDSASGGPSAARQGPTGAREDLRATFRPGSAGVMVPRSFLGLSMEYWSFAKDAGVRYPNPLLARLIRPLSVAGGPAQIRIGGRSTDRTWLEGTGRPEPRWAQVKLTPALVARLRSVAGETGSGVVAGLNLAGGDPSLASGLAGALARDLPSRQLRAFEIGNEPDLYGVTPWYGEPGGSAGSRGRIRRFSRSRSRYRFGRFMPEYLRWATAVRRVVPGARFAGPGFASLGSTRDLRAFVRRARGLGLREVTDHRYPLRSCYIPRGSPRSPSLSHMLGDGAAAGLARTVSRYVHVARRQRLPFRISEMNSVACRGAPGLSDAFASTLWGIDTLLELAHAGVSGVNIHTRPLSSYSPLYFERVAGRWSARVMPLYYAIWLFAHVTPAGTRIQPVAVPRGVNLKVWALESPGVVRLLVIDKQPGWRGVVRLAIPGSRARARLTRLESASLRGSDPPRLGGQTFGSRSYDAQLHGPQQSSSIEPGADGSYPVPFTEPGVAVLSIARSS